MCRGKAELTAMVAWVRLTYTNDSGSNGATTGARAGLRVNPQLAELNRRPLREAAVASVALP